MAIWSAEQDHQSKLKYQKPQVFFTCVPQELQITTLENANIIELPHVLK